MDGHLILQPSNFAIYATEGFLDRNQFSASRFDIREDYAHENFSR